jgi:hypothetical protein
LALAREIRRGEDMAQISAERGWPAYKMVLPAGPSVMLPPRSNRRA